tara:strand:+ start:1084 stop:1506 length:423 start_codon:yes stop_codon:yes gene_type:complete
MPKPILSDSLFNADDVATAILNKANLQITNNLFGVTHLTNLFSPVSGVSIYIQHGFAFNGFMFCQCRGAKSSIPSTGSKILDIDSNYTPNMDQIFPTVAFQGDLANYLMFTDDSEVIVHNPKNEGDGEWYFALNGFYRTD